MRARNVLHLLVAVALLFSLSAAVVGAAPAQTPLQPPANPSGILGPFTSEPIYPYVWNGDLRDLPQLAHRMPWAATPRYRAGSTDPHGNEGHRRQVGSAGGELCRASWKAKILPRRPSPTSPA